MSMKLDTLKPGGVAKSAPNQVEVFQVEYRIRPVYLSGKLDIRKINT